MSDDVVIYLIVALNTFVQGMLLWRLKFPAGGRWKYLAFAVGIPVLIMVSMRLAIAGGLIHGRVVDQSLVEQYVTAAASILLLVGPLFVTLAAIVSKKRRHAVMQMYAAEMTRPPP